MSIGESQIKRNGEAASAAENQRHAIRFEVTAKEPEKVIPDLIEYVSSLHVSDLFFNAEESQVDVCVRHLGVMRSVCSLPLELGKRCVTLIKTSANMNISERRRPLDGRWLFRTRNGNGLDLRINTIPTLHGEDCTLRILDQSYRLLSLDQLGLDPTVSQQLKQMLSSPSGLILVTGPTESGKSTTLYASLALLHNGERRISTIEDPIEYSLKGVRQSQVNPHNNVFADELLKSVLRQAPDVIMVGEIRDAETAMTAARAAGSGHLVLSTLHAPVAAAAIQSMLRLGVTTHLLSNAMRGVISQRLLRTLCPKCKVNQPLPSPKIFDEIRHKLEPNERETFCGPTGCAACHFTGYSGRTGVYEMLAVTPAIRALIDENATVSAIRAKAIEEGMLEFRHSAMIKVARGETSIAEVVRVLPSEYLF